MQNIPDSPENIAFALLMLIVEDGKMRGADVSTPAHLLDLYALCLVAVNGGRYVSHAYH